MINEITIKIKDKSKSLVEKTRVYEPVMSDICDPTIDRLIAKASKNFGPDAPMSKLEVTIKIINDS